MLAGIGDDIRIDRPNECRKRVHTCGSRNEHASRRVAYTNNAENAIDALPKDLQGAVAAVVRPTGKW